MGHENPVFYFSIYPNTLNKLYIMMPRWATIINEENLIKLQASTNVEKNHGPLSAIMRGGELVLKPRLFQCKSQHLKRGNK